MDDLTEDHHQQLGERLLDTWRTAMRALVPGPRREHTPEVDSHVEALGRDLLTRWHEPHRHYHGITHLAAGLGALAELGGDPLEVVAFWWHDAVHHNDKPTDEQQSAQLARTALAGLLDSTDIDEVARLVLLTINHDPAPDDGRGARMCDADLALLAADPDQYLAHVAQLRRERPDVAELAWQRDRIAATGALLNRPQLFWTPTGRRLWESPARRNLTDERRRLLNPSHDDEDPSA
ncbi:HD domain-containing protein [Propionibacteriaceae bacterium G57]|uniref:HD domain-containing protein n=1 Tax=Aestuariimicrobium sp. G57 TaxID=3418485 RepID=UPI003DA76461